MSVNSRPHCHRQHGRMGMVGVLWRESGSYQTPRVQSEQGTGENVCDTTANAGLGEGVWAMARGSVGGC